MASFRYKALSASGSTVSGHIDAPSEAAAIQQLRDLGHLPISAQTADGEGWWTSLDFAHLMRRRASQRDLAVATEELASLLGAGLPLDRALQILAGLGELERLREPLQRLTARVRDGASLGDAFATEPIFPKFYVSMVRAGETGGTIEATLKRLADYLARANAIRDAVTSALVYPTMLLATSGLSIIVILVFVLPEFEPLFRDAGKSLPFTTRVVMGLGDFVGTFWWIILLLMVAAASLFRRTLERPDFRLRFDGHLLRLPLFGDLLTKLEVERFARVFGTLVGNGIALPAALAITKDTLKNSVIASAVARAATSLREGEGLASELSKSGLFPSMTIDLLRVGEETGKLDEMLLRQADFYEHSVRHSIDRLLALLVPVLTIFLGVLVAGLIGSMLVAILSVNDLAF